MLGLEFSPLNKGLSIQLMRDELASVKNVVTTIEREVMVEKP